MKTDKFLKQLGKEYPDLLIPKKTIRDNSLRMADALYRIYINIIRKEILREKKEPKE